MFRPLALLLALLTSACALQGGTVNLPTPPTQIPVYTFGVVACANNDHPCTQPIVGAKISVNSSSGYVTKVTNNDGYTIFSSIIPFSDIKVEAEGYETFALSIQPPELNQKNITIGLTSLHVDPTKFSLGQLAAIRGAMWSRANICADPPLLPYGPRPFQPDNIIATTYFDNYTPDQQEAIARCLKSVGLTHVVVGGLVDWWAYHGQYGGHDYSTDEGFERFLDIHQWFWDHGLTPVTFIHEDGAGLEATQIMMRRLVAGHPRAQRLMRIIVMSGWEPARYEWSSKTWAGYVGLGRELFPNALNLIHTVTDVDAPVGTDALFNDDDHTLNPGGNGAGWARVIEAGLHGWLIQNGPYSAAPNNSRQSAEFAAQFMPEGNGATYHGAAWHFAGNAGWPTSSAWGPGIPICLYNAEDTAYEAYWANRPDEAGRAAWGDLAVNSGACGYLDGGTLPVPIRR